MPITVNCPCGQALKIPDSAIGKQVRCPKCQQILAIRSAQPSPQPQPIQPLVREPSLFDLPLPPANPYAPPLPSSSSAIQSSVGGGSSKRSRLRAIASAQRQVNLAVLVYLCLLPINVVLSSAGNNIPMARGLLAIIVLLTLSFGAFSAYRLAALFRGKAVAVVYALGLLVPILGLLLLVSISQKATSELKKNGIAVGLLGANPSSI